MTKSGAGVYYDGVTSAQHPVTVEVAPATLLVRGSDGVLGVPLLLGLAVLF